MSLHPEVRKFLSEAGKIGGSSRSPLKQEASKNNGKLGGRPKGAKNKYVKTKKSIK